MDLPAPLRAAIDGQAEGMSLRDLSQRAQRTSEAYRSGASSGGVIRGPADALAYAMVRLPATYAACRTVFAETLRRAPAFRPASLLDAGCGPGGGSWAALEAWPDISSATWLDSSRPFLELASALAQNGPRTLAVADCRRVDLAAETAWPGADLAFASYALAELAADQQEGVVRSLWAACAGVLCLVEPGAPAGYDRILRARRTLIAEGAVILAPCPHAGSCPLSPPDWCHFKVRLARSRGHRRAKGAQAPFEDEKFCYLVAARPHVAGGPAAARVLAPPRAGKPGVELKLCTPAGLERRFTARRDKASHAVARRLDWGGALGEG